MESWTTVIMPEHRWHQLDLKELWRYRDLYAMYVKRNIVIAYKQTILGPIWYIIQPLLMTVTYMFVFGTIAGISTEDVPQPLFYFSGIMLWNYYSAVFSSTSTFFIDNAPVFGKVYFPRLIIPIANATSEVVKFLIQLCLFLLMCFWYMTTGSVIHPTLTICLLPLILVTTAIQALSLGLIISSLTVKYRDLVQLVSFGLQLYMFVTPVVYPLSAAPEHYHMILGVNPLTPLFEAMRNAFLGCGSLSWGSVTYSLTFTVIIAFVALALFGKTERNFMDHV